MNTSSEVRGVYASTDAVSDAAAAVAATAAAAAAEAATSSAAAAAAARSSGLEPCLFYPSGEIEEVSIPERLRMISWLAHHTAIDLSCFTAHAKKYKGPPLKPQDPRPIDYSWVELRLNLSSPEATRLRDVFRQASVPSALRNGRLLEVLDCFAADVAFAYTRPSIVLTKDRHDLFLTVAIDSIRLFGCDPLSNHTSSTSSSSSSSSSSSIGVKETPEGASFPYISVDKDLILRGFVSYAGSSSVEITAELHQEGRLMGSACLVFVHVDGEGHPKKVLPPLASLQSSDKYLQLQLHAAELRQKARRAAARRPQRQWAPLQEESEFLHQTWLTACSRSRSSSSSSSSSNTSTIIPTTSSVISTTPSSSSSISSSSSSSIGSGANTGIVWCKDTRLESNILMQPETISMYGRAFGGYIMRTALELSFLTAQRFLRETYPVIVGMEDIRFFDAVRQGDILRLTATVVWSDRNEVQIEVDASSSAAGAPMRRTNRMSKAMRAKDPEEVQVYPQSYGEYMSFLDARRRAQKRGDRNINRDIQQQS
ncbi:acyl-CoA thioester hydrolase, putative [Eimeria acervulina]|uniref:Acyl-CoA thioester hydrolase, putative n=1 Tax=Eimeria acervulina TaxID=5801 RepID=U6GXB5_EIMAC|nr:acyl-CoA thioester hydrolase, putative [Eimeria acervulina]CDI84237.1 acyl-CoA thioester hydrolase, putative [Eimeria acervulina]